MSGEGDTKRNVLHEIYSLLAEFSDRDYQKRVWLEGRGPEVSCFADATIGFISGVEIDHVIGVEWGQWDLPVEPLQLLREFRKKLGEYVDKSGSDPPIDQVLTDPEWDKVSQLAARVMESFRAHGISP